jgi:hypothetical protein
MRTLSAAMLAEFSLDVQRPGYLIQIGFSTPVRWSTFGDVAWNGFDWLSYDVKVSGLAQDMNGVNSCTLEIGNTDLAAGALALGEGFAKKPMIVWAVYAGATATADVVEVFNGDGDRAKVSPDKVIVQTTRGQRTMFSPRRFINPGIGLSYLQPEGFRIPWGSTVFVLSRPR